MSKEFESVGFYLSSHPLTNYEDALKQFKVKTFKDFEISRENEYEPNTMVYHDHINTQVLVIELRIKVLKVNCCAFTALEMNNLRIQYHGLQQQITHNTTHKRTRFYQHPICPVQTTLFNLT